jgi:hypothetical protein
VPVDWEPKEVEESVVEGLARGWSHDSPDWMGGV